MMKLLFTFASIALAFSAHGQALPVYTSPTNKVGGALASGITQNLIRRGFAANDPRIFQTVQSVGARVIPLVGLAGTGANWIGLIGRLSPWVTGGILVYQGIKWYVDSQGNVTTTTSVSSPNSTGINAGSACFTVSGSTFCASTPEEAVLSYVLASTVYTDLTTINLTPEASGTSAYIAGRRYTSTVAGHRNNDQSAILPSYTNYYVALSTAQASCLAGYVLNGNLCVPNQLSKYIPTGTTSSAQSPQVAYNNLSQASKDSPLSQELASDSANRIWRDASLQPDYRGVPWSANDPVSAPDFTPQASLHPTDWPKTSDLNLPVPTTTTPLVSPESNPNQSVSPSTSTKVDLGPDPGIQAPMLEDTPTDLFNPIKSLLQPWLVWQVPAHSSTCPVWQGSPQISGYVFNINLNYHCTFVEQYRSVIYAAAVAGWILAAAFIILSA